MRNITRVKFLPLLFLVVLLSFLDISNRPAAAQTLADAASTVLPPTQQTTPQSAPSEKGTVSCTIARSIDIHEQPNVDSKRIATVEKQSDQTQLVLAEGSGNESWLHVAQVNYAPGISQPLSGYVFNDLKATPQQPSNAIVECVAFKAAHPVRWRNQRRIRGNPQRRPR